MAWANSLESQVGSGGNCCIFVNVKSHKQYNHQRLCHLSAMRMLTRKRISVLELPGAFKQPADCSPGALICIENRLISLSTFGWNRLCMYNASIWACGCINKAVALLNPCWWKPYMEWTGSRADTTWTTSNEKLTKCLQKMKTPLGIWRYSSLLENWNNED